MAFVRSLSTRSKLWTTEVGITASINLTNIFASLAFLLTSNVLHEVETDSLPEEQFTKSAQQGHNILLISKEAFERLSMHFFLKLRNRVTVLIYFIVSLLTLCVSETLKTAFMTSVNASFLSFQSSTVAFRSSYKTTREKKWK